jgi:hypothetical protein
MGATSVGPHIGEGNFLGSSLLEQEFPVRGSEDEGRECSMKQALVNVFHEVAYAQKKYEVNDYRDGEVSLTGLLVHGTDGIVVFVDQDTPLIH